MTSKFRRTLSMEDLAGAEDEETENLLLGFERNEEPGKMDGSDSAIININSDYDGNSTAPILQLADGIESTGSSLSRSTKNVRFQEPDYMDKRNGNDSKLQQVKDQVNDVQGVMRDNVSRLMDRESLLESLADRSDQLSYSSDLYLQSSEYLRRKMWWRQMRTKMLLSAIVVIGIFLILVPLITKLI